MLEKRKKDCPCFERLNIYGHGDNNGADGIALRSIYYEKDKKGDQENRLNLDEQGKPNQNFMTLFYGLEFCKQCRIYLRSCKIGKNDALILAIADATGCTVYSSEHNVTNPQWNDKDRDWENMGKPTGGRKWKKTSPSDAGKNKTSSDKMQ